MGGSTKSEIFPFGVGYSLPNVDFKLMTTNEEKIEAVENEWATSKNNLLKFLVSLFFIGIGYAVWVGSIQSRLTNIERQHNAIEMKVEDVSRRQQISDITGAEIKTKLISIEATLADIKQTLKEIR